MSHVQEEELRMRVRSLVAILTVLVLGGGGSAVGATRAQEASPSPEEIVFTVGVTTDIVSASPFKGGGTGEYEFFFLGYDQLLNFDKDTMEPSPGLAESWTRNEDGTEWTFKIRDGVKWSDGVPLTAHDIAWTYNYAVNTPGNYFAGELAKSSGPTFTAPDDRTFIWSTKEPTVAPLSPPWVPILPEHIWKQFEGDLKGAKEYRNVPAVGSGPFKLVEWQEGQFWTLEKQPGYWGGEPTIDKIIYRVYDRSESMVQALKAGEIDFADSIDPNLFSSLEGIPGITTWKASPNTFYNLAFGLWQPGLGPDYKGSQGETPTANTALLDPTVRIAIAKAIDKDTLVDKVLQGAGSAGSTLIFPESRWHWDPEAAGDTTQDFDPALANQMLDEAGYADTDGDGIREDPKTREPLEFTFLTITDMNYSMDNGEYVKGWLEDIGMKVNLKPVSQNKGYDLWYAHDYSGYHWSWGPAPDPDFILSIFTTGQCNVWSDGCYSNPEYDQLYEQQKVAVDPAERAKIVNEMQKIIYDEVPEIVLYYGQPLQAYRSDRWTGFVPQPAPHGSLLFQFGNYSYLNIKPVTATGADASSASSKESSPLVLIGVVVLVLIVVLVVWLRRRTSDEDKA